MNWLTKFLTSSIGKKMIMSLTGLFLIIFLVVHLIGNLQLMASDGGQAFNEYAYLMTTNPLIKTVSYGLYFFILVHIVQGLVLWSQNRSARKSRYAVSNPATDKTSQNMAWLGIIIMVFLILHLWQFWAQMKLGNLAFVPASEYGDGSIKNLYAPVYNAFKDPIYVVVYVLSMIVIALHLKHGFQSAFQTLGLNHKKYMPFIKTLGIVYSILVPLGFAIIPIYFYFFIK